ncbi:MAG: signal peptidase I [Frankiaceae bacterium]
MNDWQPGPTKSPSQRWRGAVTPNAGAPNLGAQAGGVPGDGVPTGGPTGGDVTGAAPAESPSGSPGRADTAQPTAPVQAVAPAPRRFLPRRGGQVKGQKKRLSFWKELPILILVAFVLALLIKAFFVQAFYIPSGSMQQTLEIGDRVLVNKIVYDFRDVHRGEIVVFNGDGTNFQQAEVEVPPPSNFFERILRDIQGFLGLGAPNEKDFIKRVIGVGGDTVSCCDAAGRVTVNHKPLDEPYVYYGNDVPTPQASAFTPVTVPKGYLFVMGDHRNASTDSRMVGPIPEDKVIGRAQIRIWPLSRLAWLRVPPTFDGVPPPPSAIGGDFGGRGNAVTTTAFAVPAGLLQLFGRRARRLPLRG